MKTARKLYHPIALLLFVSMATMVFLTAGTPRAAASSMVTPMMMPPPPTVHCVTTGGIDPACNDSHPTVQGAVNHALPGEHIIIMPGTYNEQVTINKDLLITTSGPGAIIHAPLSPLSPDAHGQLNVITIGGGATVTMSGLTVAGPGPGPCATISQGIFVGGNATLNISNSTVADIRDNPIGGCQNANGIRLGSQAFAEVAHGSILNNQIIDYQKTGIVADGPGTTATITGNTVTGFGNSTFIAQNGIQISRGAVAVVQFNNVSGNKCDVNVPTVCGPDPIDNTQSAGILLFQAGDETVVDDNNIFDNDIGIYNLTDGVTTISRNTLTNNRYEGIYQDQGTGHYNHNTVAGSNISLFIATFTGNSADSVAILNGNTLPLGPGGDIITDDEDFGDGFNAFFQNVFCAAPPSGLVSWFPGDGNTTDVIGTNNGTAVGGLTFSLAGEVDQAFRMNGVDSGVTAPNSPSLNFGPNANFSIDAWIKIPVSAQATKPILDIVDKRSFSPNAAGYAMFLLNGQLGVQLADGGAVFNYVGPSTGELRDGLYHFVAATVTRTSVGTFAIRLYVDGVLKDTLAANPLLTDLTNTGAFDIGFNPDPGVPAGTKFAIGLIDEVELFNRALTGGEVNSIFQAQIAGKCKVTDVGITKSHTGTFTVGLTGTYNITVTNTGTIKTTSPITVTDNLPAGMNFLAIGAGSDPGWLCSGTTTVTCTNNASLPVGGTSLLKLDVTVANAGLKTNNATVSMAGDSNAGNDSANDSQTVNKAATTTALVVNINPSVFGQTVTFTATVTATGITPIGNVQFFDGITPLGAPVATSVGIAQLPISSLTVGSHPITAQFLVNADFLGSTSNIVNQVVNPANTNTSLVSSVNPSVFQQSVTFTATTTVIPPGGGTLTGTVTFKDGATTLTTLPIGPGGVTAFSTSALAVGNHPITATYNGDGNHNGSLSNVIIQTVNKANTTLVLTSSANPANPGGVITFTATINVTPPGAGSPIPPTGTVTFKEGATTLGIRPVVGAGVATFSTALLGSGQHLITAFYSGDGNFNGSTSNTLTQTIGRVDLFLNQSTGQDPVYVGDTLHYEIGVGSGGPDTAFNVVAHLSTPPGTFFASVSTDKGSCTAPPVGFTGNITCSMGTFVPGENHHIQLFLFVDTMNPTITNVVTLTTDSLDVDLSNNTNSRTVKVILISALSMPSMSVNSKAQNLDIIGENFPGGSTVQVNGVSKQTTFISNKKLRITLTSADTSKAKSLTLRVLTPDGRLTNQKVLMVQNIHTKINRGTGTGDAAPETNAPTQTASQSGTTTTKPSSSTTTRSTSTSTTTVMPMAGDLSDAVSAIKSLSVTTVAQGEESVKIEITGSNFQTGSTVQVNGEERETEVVDGGKVVVTLTADDLAKAGDLKIKVVDQQGRASNVKVIKVTDKK